MNVCDRQKPLPMEQSLAHRTCEPYSLNETIAKLVELDAYISQTRQEKKKKKPCHQHQQECQRIIPCSFVKQIELELDWGYHEHKKTH